MKILWGSVSPTTPSGYGKQTKEIVSRLCKMGFDVLVVGNQTLGSTLKLDGMTILPRGGASYLDDVLQIYYDRYKRELLFTLFDVWVLDYIVSTRMRWIPVVPVDAELFPECERILGPLNSAYRIVAYSRFGYQELSKFFSNVSLIPHGVDLKTYRPLEDKGRYKKQLGLKEDSFIFGTVATNIGDRKDFPKLLKCFSRFLRSVDSDNVYLYLHTDTQAHPGVAYDIEQLARKYGVLERVRVPPFSPGLMPFTEEQMVRLYNSFDVFVSASRGEGFGVPFLEAMACGVPCIGPNHSAITELLEDSGILVKTCGSIIPLTVPTLQEYPLVDEQSMVNSMVKIYNCSEMRRYYSLRGIEKAKEYDWEKLMPQWAKLISETEEEIQNLKELVRG